MPEIDFGDQSRIDLISIAPPTLGRTLATYHLIAHMHWPKNQSLRDQFLTTMLAKARQIIEDLELQPGDPDFSEALATTVRLAISEVIENFLDPEFRARGGYGTVAEAPGLSALQRIIRNNGPKWYVTGTLLLFVMTMANHHSERRGGASISKAVHLFENIVETPDIPTSRKEILRIWGTFKPVAHFCAAFMSLVVAAKTQSDYEQDTLLQGMFIDGLGRFLSFAREFQEFGTGFYAQGTKKPMLPPDETWLIPQGLRLPPAKIRPRPLTDHELEVLEQYRAPVLY